MVEKNKRKIFFDTWQLWEGQNVWVSMKCYWNTAMPLHLHIVYGGFCPIQAELNSCNMGMEWVRGKEGGWNCYFRGNTACIATKVPQHPHFIHIPHLLLLLLLLSLAAQCICYQILCRKCLPTLGPTDNISIFREKYVIIRKVSGCLREKKSRKWKSHVPM